MTEAVVTGDQAIKTLESQLTWSEHQRHRLLEALKALVAMYGPSTDYADAAQIVWADAEDAIAQAEDE